MLNLLIFIEPSEDVSNISWRAINLYLNTICIDEDAGCELSGVYYLKSEEPLNFTLKQKLQGHETENEKIILSALQKAAESEAKDLPTHIFYAEQFNLDLINWDFDVFIQNFDSQLLNKIVQIGLKSPTMTFIYMYKDLLITNEKKNRICTSNGYRQKDHETPTGGDTYTDSVADDLESFLEDIKLGRKPLSLTWTYFTPQLTLKEIDLVEKMDREYFRTFKCLNSADVKDTELRVSNYILAYCRRKTIAIESQKFLEKLAEEKRSWRVRMLIICGSFIAICILLIKIQTHDNGLQWTDADMIFYRDLILSHSEVKNKISK